MEIEVARFFLVMARSLNPRLKRTTRVDDSVQNCFVERIEGLGREILEDSEFVKFVIDSIINVDDHDKLTPPEKKEFYQRNTSFNFSSGKLSGCRMGATILFLDEQIGLICNAQRTRGWKYEENILESRHITLGCRWLRDFLILLQSRILLFMEKRDVWGFSSQVPRSHVSSSTWRI
ncbi:hypothetical protein HAX54_004105 [Datura stramonium]|uniref:Uncharacterized protein n=1 Tax=Datura stramonium TaxID=4076 RepID=A0ABS8WVN7_DATST|nr:hypothetical protein [Datura stramonium]